jgi:hypothetical protein
MQGLELLYGPGGYKITHLPSVTFDVPRRYNPIVGTKKSIAI